MQAIGCLSSSTSGAPWIGMRGCRSPCKPRARNFSPEASLAVPGEDESSSVHYDDVATQWLSADFLDLRLRSSGNRTGRAAQSLVIKLREGKKIKIDLFIEVVELPIISQYFLTIPIGTSLICNEATQALRSHFKKKDNIRIESDFNNLPSTTVQYSLQDLATSANQGNRTRALPNVVVLDETFFSQRYNSNGMYTAAKCSFLDESFC